MKRWIMRCAVMAVAAAAPGLASAQQCAGLMDIPASDPFCSSVEWIKNRGITQGCDAVPNYCPQQGVTRMQMALFMNRLGDKLTAEVLSNQNFDDGGGEGLTLPGEQPTPALVRCVTPETAAVPYPRRAVATATFSALSMATPAGFRAFLLVNDGTGYTNFDALSVAHRGTAQPTVYGSAALTEQVALEPNKPYRFALGLRRDNTTGLGTTGDFAFIRCQITVTVHNRNETPSP